MIKIEEKKENKAKIKYGKKNLKELLDELIKEQYVVLIKKR